MGRVCRRYVVVTNVRSWTTNTDEVHPFNSFYCHPQAAHTSSRQTAQASREELGEGSKVENRHPVLQARRVSALDWNHYEKNISWKVIHWFEVITSRKILQDPAILAENIYNMDETRVMLSMPGSVKVLIGKDNKRNYRGARVKRTSVTAIKCISTDGRYLDPMIIWPATTHQSNWTTFPTPGW